MGDGTVSEWVEWKGGECPVDPETTVEVRFRYMAGLSGFQAKELDWLYEGDGGDIIAYRVVKP